MSTEAKENKAKLLRILSSIVDHARSVRSGLAEEMPATTHYMRGQVNRIREELAKSDEFLAELFPPVPGETSICDVAAVAEQLIDYAGDESLAARAARLAREGLHVHGENVSISLPDLSELGTQIRVRVAEAFDQALHPGGPRSTEEIDAKIEELGKALQEAAERVAQEVSGGPSGLHEVVAAAKELARLHAKKARRSVRVTLARDEDDDGDDESGSCCPPQGCCE
jgi:hypothetical protein